MIEANHQSLVSIIPTNLQCALLSPTTTQTTLGPCVYSRVPSNSSVSIACALLSCCPTKLPFLFDVRLWHYLPTLHTADTAWNLCRLGWKLAFLRTYTVQRLPPSFGRQHICTPRAHDHSRLVYRCGSTLRKSLGLR